MIAPRMASLARFAWVALGGLALSSMLACGDSSDSGSSCSEGFKEQGDAVARFAAKQGPSVEDCGAVTRGAAGGTCTAQTEAPIACLASAFQHHTAARLRVTYTSEEGAPIVHDLFVIPEQGASSLVTTFVDNRADGWADPKCRGVFTLTCGTLVTTAAEGGCLQVSTADCMYEE